MSKSLARLRAALQDAGLPDTIMHMAQSTRTAADAALAAGCAIDQIAKSILFAGEASGALYLFITAGGNQVDPAQASALAGEALMRADAQVVRAVTGFAIGGVAPFAHLTRPRAWCDPRLTDFTTVYAAAGTPQHIFAIAPEDLLRLSGAQLARFTA